MEEEITKSGNGTALTDAEASQLEKATGEGYKEALAEQRESSRRVRGFQQRQNSVLKKSGLVGMTPTGMALRAGSALKPQSGGEYFVYALAIAGDIASGVINLLPVAGGVIDAFIVTPLVTVSMMGALSALGKKIRWPGIILEFIPVVNILPGFLLTAFLSVKDVDTTSVGGVASSISHIARGK